MSDEPLPQRPVTRADCVNAARPCAWVTCRHHLGEVIVAENGRMRLGVLRDETLDIDATPEMVQAFVERASEAIANMSESCALDIADREPDGASLGITGNALGLSRERVRQIEGKALRDAPSPLRRLLDERIGDR